MKVAGVGQCSLDFIASVARFPKEDTKLEAMDITVQGGGPVATALVSLARLGVKTSFVGVVSDDAAGLEIREGLGREGVDVRGLVTRPGGSSQRAFIMVNRKNGSRTIIWRRPTAHELKPAEVKKGSLAGSSMLLIDGLMHRASKRAALMAKRENIPVMLDAGKMREGMLELLGLSDYIVASEEFALSLSSGPEGALKKLSSFNPAAATITLGKRGSLTWHQGRISRSPAFSIKAVDTTGAGDVFHGGYIYGIINGWDIGKTILFASAFAALKCLRLGGRAGIPGLKETLAFIKACGR